MKLEDIVCSLEYAMKLKELSVKQDAHFCWAAIENPLAGVFKESEVKNWDIVEEKMASKSGADWQYSAFTASELGEKLPYRIDSKNFTGCWHLKFAKFDYGYQIYYGKIKEYKDYETLIEFKEKTEVDARAKMLIHLIENKLGEVEK